MQVLPRVLYELPYKDVTADGKPAHLLDVSLRPTFYFTLEIRKA